MLAYFWDISMNSTIRNITYLDFEIFTAYWFESCTDERIESQFHIKYIHKVLQPDSSFTINQNNIQNGEFSLLNSSTEAKTEY